MLREEVAKFPSRIDFMMDLKRGPRTEARELSWWLKDGSDVESATTDRNRAFLRAYLRIAGDGRLYAEGIPLADRGRVYLDRSVVRRLHRDGFVDFVQGRDPYFEVTATGQELLKE